MPSIQSRLLYLTMRNMHLLRFRLKRESWDWNTSVEEFRRRCEQTNGRLAKLPEDIQITPVKIDGLAEGLSAEWLRPSQAPADKVIFYTHGGGYISGSCTDHRSIVAKLAQSCGIQTLLFDYRLAPENPFPAALDDALTAYSWLLGQGFSSEQIVIVGESAGGGLALATLLALKDKGQPMPAGAVVLSPETDLKLTGESHRTKARVCLSPPGMAQVCAKYYAGENDAGNPYISPLYGDLHGLPPLLMYVGEYETLQDDSTRFAEKARTAGVQVSLTVGEGMVHCYPLLAPLFPEATRAMREIGEFVHAQLDGQPLSHQGTEVLEALALL
jgi:monoterpene epsilon-lactone hydrolase